MRLGIKETWPPASHAPDEYRTPHRTQLKTGRIVSVNCSGGGVPKSPIFEALITESGIRGDHQQDQQNHGGPDRAVLLYSLEAMLALQREGHPICIGSTGENLTISGLDWNSVTPGVYLRAADVKLLVTKYTTPCYKIAGSFLSGDYSRISQKLHPGWSRISARVISGGVVRAGDPIEIIEF